MRIALAKPGLVLGLSFVIGCSAATRGPRGDNRTYLSECDSEEARRAVDNRVRPEVECPLGAKPVGQAGERVACQLDDGTPEGLVTEWNEDGFKRSEALYHRGKLEGRRVTWYEGGAIQESSDFLTGRLHGCSIRWHANGQLAERGRYVVGSRSGVWTFWDDGAGKRSEGPFVLNRRDGLWIAWDESGALIERAGYSSGQLHGEWNRTGPNGVHSIGEYVHGKKQGTWLHALRVDKSGGEVEIRRAEYDSGKAHGQWRENDREGHLRESGRFERGKKVGTWKSYYEDGTVAEVGEYVDGLKQGQWTRTHRNGKLQAIAEYRAGELVGSVQRWTESGDPLVAPVEEPARSANKRRAANDTRRHRKRRK